MYYQIEQVLEKQNYEIEKYYKGRGILVCETPEGLFALKEFHGKEKKAEFLYRLGAHLKSHGISCDYMIKNKEGELLTEGCDGIRYSFHHWGRARECDVRNRGEVVRAAAFLAGFHEAVKDFDDAKSADAEKDFGESDRTEQPESGGQGCQNESLQEEYDRHDRQLRRIRKYILPRHDKTDYERLYLKSFPEFIRQSGEALQYIEESRELFQKHSVTICHGDFNQHNAAIAAGRMSILHLEHARQDAKVTDLCNYVRKVLEKHDWNEMLGLEMIREYNAVSPLNGADWKELYARLCYPEKYWKIANRYMNAGKVLDSGINYEKLQRVLRQNSARKRFLDALKRTQISAD